MQKYALIQNNEVVELKDLQDEEVAEALKTFQLAIDITDQLPQPEVGWKFVGNKLEPFDDNLSDEERDLIRMDRRFRFGNALCDEAVKILSVRNRALDKSSAQVNQIISTFTPIEMALRKCALPTAAGGIQAMAPSFPEYSQDFDYLLGKLNSFLANEV